MKDNRADGRIDVEGFKDEIIRSGGALAVLDKRSLIPVGRMGGKEVKIRNDHRGETTPSASWNQSKGVLVDFGDDAYNGSLIDVVMHIDGVDFPTACQIMADELGIELLRIDGMPYAGPRREIDPATRDARAADLEAERTRHEAERHAKEKQEAVEKARNLREEILPTYWDPAIPAHGNEMAERWPLCLHARMAAPRRRDLPENLARAIRGSATSDDAGRTAPGRGSIRGEGKGPEWPARSGRRLTKRKGPPIKARPEFLVRLIVGS